MDLIKDYDAKDADLRMTQNGAEAMILFLTTEGWVGVTLGRADLVRFQDRVRHVLSAPTLPDRQH
jgi:hypothetical protein